MTTLLFFIFFGLAVLFGVLCGIVYKKTKDDNSSFVLFILSLIAFGFSVYYCCNVISLINEIGTGHIIDDSIEMYTAENAAIEATIDDLVSDYMDYESSVYQKLKDKDLISLVSLVPDLKANTLVQRQINIYLENNEKIKQLRQEQINLAKARWLLYFGS